LVADLDLDVITGLDADRDACEPDRLRERRRERAARRLAFARGSADPLMAAQHASLVEEHEADELALRRRRERGLADEFAPVLEIDRRGGPRLRGILALGHVWAVEIHACLEPQRVACAQAAWVHPRGCECVPETRRARRGEDDFEAVLSGVARS